MNIIREYINSLSYEEYESKEEMIDSATCELIDNAADYNRVAELVTIALDEREARETA